MTHAFDVSEVQKHYGDVTALAGVSLHAEVGKIYGLLGPNGAGKSTIVKVLATLCRPDSGTAKVLGFDVLKQAGKVRQLIGLAGQYAAVDEFQTGYENVYMVARLYGVPHKEARRRTRELLERLDLVEAADRQVGTYSGGMRRRLDLGASLVGRPQVLFLDEPTTGLDPKTRNDSWNIVRELVRDGTSILLTTQYLDEADELADLIAVVDSGRLIAEGTSDQHKAGMGSDVIELVLADASDAPVALQLTQPLSKATPTYSTVTKTVTVPVTGGSQDLMRVVQALNDGHIQVTDLALRRPSLDDVFLSLTGKATAARPNGSGKLDPNLAGAA